MNKKKMTTYQLAVTALMAALLCVLGPVSIPIGEVSMTLQNFVIYLSVILLGWKLGTVSVLIYLLLGAMGLPVFSGWIGGLAKLAGPTGGYLVGFIPMAIVAGLFFEKSHGRAVLSLCGMALGLIICYALGTAWFCVQMDCTLGYALTVCVLPFLLFDACKIAVAWLLGKLLRGRLQKAGFLKALA